MQQAKSKSLVVYLERRKSRQFVGMLSKAPSNYKFEYDDKYLYSRSAIPLGPDLPLTEKVHHSKELFQTFQDRIPSRKNPAYEEYCEQMGISPEEKDSIVLLSSIGQRGPSSFIFELSEGNEFDRTELMQFRNSLGLTTREFGQLFDVSPATVNRIEKGLASGKEVLKRIEIYKRFPEVALFELKRRGMRIHESKKELVRSKLEGMLR